MALFSPPGQAGCTARRVTRGKRGRVGRLLGADRVIDVHCTLTVEKLRHEAETTIRLSGTTLHAATVHDDMYAAIDLMADKLDEQLRRHKEKHRDPQAARHRHGTGISP